MTPSPSIEEMTKALEGVTPGPWEAKQNAYGAVFIYGGETLTSSVGTEYKELVAGGNSHDTLKMANARYIAACSPDRMRDILELAARAEAAETRITSALMPIPASRLAQDVWDEMGTVLAVLEFKEISPKARALIREALESATGCKSPQYLGGKATPTNSGEVSC